MPMPVVECCPCLWPVLPVPVVGLACARGQGAARARGWVLPMPMVGRCPCPWSGPAQGWILPVVERLQVPMPMTGSARGFAMDKTCLLLMAP